MTASITAVGGAGRMTSPTQVNCMRSIVKPKEPKMLIGSHQKVTQPDVSRSTRGRVDKQAAGVMAGTKSSKSYLIETR